MATPKKREFCKACNQITTQVRDVETKAWKCLCCESAKYRTAQKTQEIKQKNTTKKRLNITF